MSYLQPPAERVEGIIHNHPLLDEFSAPPEEYGSAGHGEGGTPGVALQTLSLVDSRLGNESRPVDTIV